MKKTVFITAGSKAVMYDADKNFAQVLNNTRTNIDWVYVAPEDCEIRYKDKSTKKMVVKQASKGDLIVQFYDTDGFKNICAVVKNIEWKENMAGLIAADEALRKKMQDSCEALGCCDCGR